MNALLWSSKTQLDTEKWQGTKFRTASTSVTKTRPKQPSHPTIYKGWIVCFFSSLCSYAYKNPLKIRLISISTYPTNSLLWIMMLLRRLTTRCFLGRNPKIRPRPSPELQGCTLWYAFFRWPFSRAFGKKWQLWRSKPLWTSCRLNRI